MENDKLEALLRNMLADVQQLSDEAAVFRMRAQHIDQRVLDLQHAIARLAYHAGINLSVRRATRQPVRRRTGGRRR
jgi:hypothetical protein